MAVFCFNKTEVAISTIRLKGTAAIMIIHALGMFVKNITNRKVVTQASITAPKIIIRDKREAIVLRFIIFTAPINKQPATGKRIPATKISQVFAHAEVAKLMVRNEETRIKIYATEPRILRLKFRTFFLICFFVLWVL